ncbi:hypothetical protein BN2476_930002 [Paraburkholderia piptadeniae]|uniref:Uncharacterized protein n=1 Tax=Paraburkholderia piptadeniae TaxID=1701573 RepID=A0A1N7STM1_9BURK|nr:hypothetical protein BN2476_930002 [Paraburkholderia piptadeniae]
MSHGNFANKKVCTPRVLTPMQTTAGQAQIGWISPCAASNLNQRRSASSVVDGLPRRRR